MQRNLDIASAMNIELIQRFRSEGQVCTHEVLKYFLSIYFYMSIPFALYLYREEGQKRVPYVNVVLIPVVR